jgi:hypothetical protein
MPAKSILPSSWDVPQKFRDRLGSKVGRQRAMFADDHLLLVLHAPPAPDQDERQGRFFWRKPDGTWISDQLGTGPGAVTKHLDEYAGRIDVLDKQEEKATAAHERFEILEALAPLQRAARNMYTVLQEARKQCPDAREIIDMRDRAYEIERTAELLTTDAKNALDFLMARQAEAQAESSHRMAAAAHRLNLLAAFFFPLATLSAIFGMDIRHGLEDLPTPHFFIAVILVGLLFGAILTCFVRVPKQKKNVP